MNENAKTIYDAKLIRLKKKLKDNQFGVTVLESKDEVLPYLQNVIEKGATIGVGGSVTLEETGVLAWLTDNPDYKFIDRYHTDDKRKALRDSLLADVYLTSTNAITMNGELYNVDGTGNRVAALIYGPDLVYVIAGVNKITDDIDDAVKRVEKYAAPVNNVRLKKENPCVTFGECLHCNKPTSICNQFVITRRSGTPGRIHVVLVNDELGY